MIVVGGFQGTIDYGAGVLTSAGMTDAYAAKFGPDGAAEQVQAATAGPETWQPAARRA